jgi:hypothetical protein
MHGCFAAPSMILEAGGVPGASKVFIVLHSSARVV